MEVKEDGKTIVNCIDHVYLETINAEGQYNYASILGPNLYYGIVADHLYHENHLQTNFAVNHYTGHGMDTRPDLSGTSGGQIVIAEYNKLVSDFWNGGPVNGVGDKVITNDKAGQLKIGSPLNATLVAYVDKNSGAPGELGRDDAKVLGNLAQTAVIQTEGKELSDNIVEPALHYMDNISAELASQPATFVPPIPSQGKMTIDTKSFPDDATIFIDADRIKNFIGNAGQLIIEKKPDQMIVFNFKETHSKTEEIMLAQFVVKQDGFPAEGYTTATPEGTGTKENEYMDAIARHIVWNLYGVQGKSTIDISAGIFLQPNEDSVIDVKGTSAGWLVSEGLVSNGSGEWHNVFAEMPDTASVKLNAFKTVDGKQPRASQKFNFFLDEYDMTESGNWRRIYSDTKNTTGSISFPEIKNITTGWHVYRITEDQVKPADTNGIFIMDNTSYYAVVKVQAIKTDSGLEATIVSTPTYYRNFNPNDFNPSSDTLSGVIDEDRIQSVVFENEAVTKGLNILKKVKGTTAKDAEFTFQVELWYENDDNTITPYVKEGDQSEELMMITASGEQSFKLDPKDNAENHSVGYVTLKAGELVSIQGINESAHYKITEIKVNGKEIDEDPVDGYTPLTDLQEGIMTGDAAKAVFENEYKSAGTLDLKAHKTLTDKTGNNKTLNANTFAFRLTGHNVVSPEDWIWNDADGNVTFPQIHYTNADMDGAVPDPNNDNKLTKKLVYTIHEKHELGTGATGLAAQNVSYADDKTVTVTLVDDGKGNITATADVTELTAEFENTYEYKVSKGFDGIKVLTGRAMKDQEFWFNAVLTKYSDGRTEYTYADDVARERVDFISATKVEGTNTADGKIAFPVITFKQAGIYTFTVTEDETRLPEGVEPTTPGQRYEVTIVVTEGKDSNTDEKILVAGEPTYTNDKTIKNKTTTVPDSKYINIGLEKKWTDGTNTTPPEGAGATFTVHQQKSTKSGGGSDSGNLIVQLYGADKNTLLAERRAGIGDKISFSGKAAAYQYTNVQLYRFHENWENPYAWDHLDGTGTGETGAFIFTHTIANEDVTDSQYVKLAIESSDFISKCTEGPAWDGVTPAYTDYEETSFKYTVTLPTSAGNWSTTIENLIQEDADGNLYRYYITEDSCTPVASDVSFVDGEGKDIKDPTVAEGVNQTTASLDTHGQKVVVTNTYEPPQNGALKLTKVVQVDGHSPQTTTEKQHVNGDYIFKITKTVSEEGASPEVIKYVQITVTDGAAASYKVADTEGALTTAEAKTSSFALITDLPVGDYLIEEVNKNGLMLTGIVRGNNEETAVDKEKGTVTVHVTANDTAAAQASAQATFTNSYYENDEPDQIALDIVKTFYGISSIDDVPNDFEVVVGYTLNGVEKTIDLKKEQNETNSDGIKILETTDGLKLSWHITNIPSEATDFRIKEVNYDKVSGYVFTAATLDGSDITNTAGEWHSFTVTAPTATLTDVTNERRPSDSHSNRKFYLEDSDILLSKLTESAGTLVISKKSLNTLQRDAVEAGWPEQGGFKKDQIYWFSIEEHPEGFGYGGKTVTFSKSGDNTIVTFTSSASAQEAVFAVSYDSHTEVNNASLTNTYTPQSITVDVVKVKQGDSATKLEGAEFTLRKLTDDPEAKYPKPTTNGTFDGAAVTGSPKTTDSTGKVSFEDLTQGYYELTETKAPQGYIMANTIQVFFRINDGKVTWIDWSPTGSKWIDKTTDTMVSFENAKEAVADNTETPEDESQPAGNATFTVQNTPGSQLPETGGIGTTLFTALGGLMTVAAGAVLTLRRTASRRRGEKQAS